MPFPGLRYHSRMPDADDKLTPADPREVVTALSLGLTSGRQLGSPFAAAARTSAERRALAKPARATGSISFGKAMGPCPRTGYSFDMSRSYGQSVSCA
jgi:hypothetical protein